jgi:CTP:molybdopterin cytidylyltransferase MocA
VTVAAVVLAATPASALADAAGRPAVRRIAESAWAGGAVPIVVLAHDPDGAVQAAVAGSEASLEPLAPVERGPVGQIVHGMDIALARIADTDAAIVWPAPMAWADAETVTSLIEAHGATPDAVLRPTWGGQPGWPVLVPVAHRDVLAGLPADRMPDELVALLADRGIAVTALELGDPGTWHDVRTPIDALPPYDGPPGPMSSDPPEWGIDADDVGDSPLSGAGLGAFGPVDPELRPDR